MLFPWGGQDTAEPGRYKSMISGISQGAADVSRSLDALAALLVTTNDRAMQMAEKLLKAGVEQTIQDSTLGTRIDISA